MVVEVSRWAVLQTETTPDSVITHWISTACQQHYQLDVLMGAYSLAADLSFKSFIADGQETTSDSRVLLQLYECQEHEEPLSWLLKLWKSTKWVAIIQTRQ